MAMSVYPKRGVACKRIVGTCTRALKRLATWRAMNSQQGSRSVRDTGH